jgi:Flp pilus assembly protein TadG
MNRRSFKLSDRRRRGNILVLTGFFMIVMVALLAMGIDIGYLQNAKVELQKSADAACIAAAWELVDDDSLTGAALNLTDDIISAREKAVEYAAANTVCASSPTVDPNTANSPDGDIVVGYLSDPSDPSCTLDTSDPTKYNAVQVRVRRNSTENGEVPMFFGKALGVQSVATEARATAALLKNLNGFTKPTNGDTIDILPFALDKQTWDNMLAGGGSDSYKWNGAMNAVQSGGDGIREVNLFPQGTGSPGNRGTVDIGGANNATVDIKRQIESGITASDMEGLGKPLEFDTNGKLTLNGETGISAATMENLASIIGQKRIIPIFESVSESGNNANFTIVQWAGVRVLDVKLTGSMTSKKLIVQPAHVFSKWAKPTAEENTSWYVYSPAWIVR